MEKIAVVGSGIAGLGVAWLLRERASVTVFEAEDRPGGHANTVMAGDQPVDTGFIVLNDRNYPYFESLLDELSIETIDSDMSFAVTIGHGAIEWAGDNWRTLFAQKSLIADRAHWRMIADILRFNRQAKRLLAHDRVPDCSLGEFLDNNSYSEAFAARYLLPMAAAIWSTPTAGMRAFPVGAFLRFFDNHGLLELANRPQWRTVAGGSRRYVRAIADVLGERLRLSSPVGGVRRDTQSVTVTLEDGRSEAFDQVVFACHADQTRRILGDASPPEARVLSAFGFQPNRALLHSDAALMPRRRAVWASWNYAADRATVDDQRVSVTYWMNRLQSIQGPTDYFVSLNPLVEPAPDKLIREIEYDHPIFDAGAIAAQRQLADIQGIDRAWFCGAWCGYGFHEDGLAAATRVAKGLGVTAPWAG
ncbi:FAD-dependent oxidoreductase [Salinisphaera sp. T31B1]|uniref:NAD(P)/FAD-dependent oxidoreductase n=1 Tax=Salinisphaera sp. T31B1 TaxID=727963 RepID=UPI00333E4AC8